MEQYLNLDWLPTIITLSTSYPTVCHHLPLSYPSVNHCNSNGERWFMESSHSGNSNNFKDGICQLYSSAGYQNIQQRVHVGRTDWEDYGKVCRMYISGGLSIFAECMRCSLEEKLARNFKTFSEVARFTLPYWDKLPDDEKQSWIRRAEIEKKADHYIYFRKAREKTGLDMGNSDFDAESELDPDELPAPPLHFQEEKTIESENREATQPSVPVTPAIEKQKNSNSASDKSKNAKMRISNGKTVSFTLPERPIRRRKERNALIKVLEAFDRFSTECKRENSTVNDNSKLFDSSFRLTSLKDNSQEAGSPDYNHCYEQPIQMRGSKHWSCINRWPKINSTLQIKKEPSWNDCHKKSGKEEGNDHPFWFENKCQDDPKF